MLGQLEKNYLDSITLENRQEIANEMGSWPLEKIIFSFRQLVHRALNPHPKDPDSLANSQAILTILTQSPRWQKYLNQPTKSIQYYKKRLDNAYANLCQPSPKQVEEPKAIILSPEIKAEENSPPTSRHTPFNPLPPSSLSANVAAFFQHPCHQLALATAAVAVGVVATTLMKLD